MDINYKAIKQLEKKRYEILYEKGYDAISFLKNVVLASKNLHLVNNLK